MAEEQPVKMAPHGHWGNAMTKEEILKASDNFEKLMNRCWYAVAGNLVGNDQDGFWEINWWNGKAREGKKIFTNQTVVSNKGKLDVSPVWPGHIVDGTAKWTMRQKMLFFTMSMGTIQYEWFSFPENDSHTEFWCVGAKVFPVGPVVFVFCQDPHVSAEHLDAFLETLKRKHSMKCVEKFKKVKWPQGYKPGDMGEFAFNNPGGEPTIDHSKNKWASRVLAKPYPPLAADIPPPATDI